MATRTDTERLDWLQAHGEYVTWIDSQSGDASACHLAYALDGTDDRKIHETGGGTLREAIDDAMAHEENRAHA
jgi:hypothetical protein